MKNILAIKSYGKMVAAIVFSMIMMLQFTCFAETRQEQLNNMFFNAIKNGDLKTAQSMLNSGADINAHDAQGNNVFSYAYYNFLKDYAGITRFLLSNGANVNMRVKDGKTPLMCGLNTTYCSLEALYVLLANGADVNARDNYLNTPLTTAFSNQYGNSKEGRKFVIALLSKGADINAKNSSGASPFLLYLDKLWAESETSKTKDETLAFVKYLVAKGADYNDSVSGLKAIDLAYRRNNIPVYQYLLALEQGKISVPKASDSSTKDSSANTGKNSIESTIPIEDVNIGWIAPGQTMKHVEDVYGKPQKRLENDGRLLYLYKDGRFTVAGDKEGDEYKVSTVLCFQDTQQTPQGFKVGMPFKSVTDKYGMTKGVPVKPKTPFYKDFELNGCKQHLYVGGNAVLIFMVDKNQIIKSIQFYSNLDGLKG